MTVSEALAARGTVAQNNVANRRPWKRMRESLVLCDIEKHETAGSGWKRKCRRQIGAVRQTNPTEGRREDREGEETGDEVVRHLETRSN
jgi:hypothetical protein